MNYNNLFETIKKEVKKIYYSKKLFKCTGDIKKTWKVMEDIIGKSKIKLTNLPSRVTINKVDVYNKPETAYAFDDFLQIFVRNWPVKYQNHLKHLKHI